MYAKGDAKLSAPLSKLSPGLDGADYTGRCFIEYDMRLDDELTLPDVVVYLPHSCERWVIGGWEEVQLMIDDLTNLLEHLPQ